ncbi:hypothetical protein DPSP01_013096 [Paraphaeosphaeria sporulosa]
MPLTVGRQAKHMPCVSVRALHCATSSATKSTARLDNGGRSSTSASESRGEAPGIETLDVCGEEAEGRALGREWRLGGGQGGYARSSGRHAAGAESGSHPNELASGRE